MNEKRRWMYLILMTILWSWDIFIIWKDISICLYKPDHKLYRKYFVESEDKKLEEKERQEWKPNKSKYYVGKNPIKNR